MTPVSNRGVEAIMEHSDVPLFISKTHEGNFTVSLAPAAGIYRGLQILRVRGSSRTTVLPTKNELTPDEFTSWLNRLRSENFSIYREF